MSASAVAEKIEKQDVEGSGRPRLKDSLQQMLAVVSLVVIIIVFSFLSPNFLTMANVGTILTMATVTGILALGVTFIIITGGIDLSLGTMMILCGVMAGVFITNIGMPVWLGVICTIAFGGCLGFINGFNVAVFNVPPFIATLAMMMVTAGLSLVVSGTKPIYFNDTPSFSKIMTLPVIPGTRFTMGILIFIFMIIIAWFLLSHTLLGRYDFAIGSNEKATALSGVDVTKWKIIIYTLCGLFVGVAGILSAARMGNAQPTGGAGLELEAIAAVVIGGTSLAGGKGSISGTVIGALIMASLTNGLRIVSVPQEWQQVFIGVIILVAVYVDIIRRKNN